MKPERLTQVLEAILERLGRLEDLHADSKALGAQLVELAKDHAADLTELRGRLIEESSRRGDEINRHQRAILDHESRLHRLESPLNGKGH